MIEAYARVLTIIHDELNDLVKSQLPYHDFLNKDMGNMAINIDFLEKVNKSECMIVSTIMRRIYSEWDSEESIVTQVISAVNSHDKGGYIIIKDGLPKFSKQPHDVSKAATTNRCIRYDKDLNGFVKVIF